MEVEMREISCPNCGVVFCITNSFNSRLRESHETFYCPRGHSQSYKGETEEIKRKRAERLLDNARRSRDKLFHSNSALRGVITKMRNKK